MKYEKRKGNYMFTDKTHPVEAIISVIIGVAILITVCVLSYKSSLSGGNGPISYGIISFYAMILSFATFVVSAMTLRDKEVFRLFPTIATILNGSVFLILFVLYMIGISA